MKFKKIFFNMCLITPHIFYCDQSNTEINAYDESLSPKIEAATYTPVDRSDLSVHEIIKEVEHFNDYMTHLAKKQQQKALIYAMHQKQQHLEEIQQIQLIYQKLSFLTQNPSDIDTHITHTSAIKTLQSCLDKIQDSYEAGLLSITTFETVSKLLQDITNLLENYILENSKNIDSLQKITNIATTIKDYQACKKISQLFAVSYRKNAQAVIEGFPKQLSVSSPAIQKIVTSELQSIQQLSIKKNNILERQLSIKLKAIGENLPHLQHLRIDPFTFLSNCLEKIAHHNQESKEYSRQKEIIEKLQKNNATIPEINEAIQFVSGVINTKNQFEATRLHTIFKTENIQEMKQTFQESIQIISNNYQSLQKVCAETKQLSVYLSLQDELIQCQQQISKKEKVLKELEATLAKIQDFLSDL